MDGPNPSEIGNTSGLTFTVSLEKYRCVLDQKIKLRQPTEVAEKPITLLLHTINSRENCQISAQKEV